MLIYSKMPIVDGLTSTQMIRQCERSAEHVGHSSLAQCNGRIPIFAVSASLVESEKQKYVDAGFDAWILKPIDFQRLNTLLTGIFDDETRRKCLYEPGEWERGGWLSERGASEGGSGEETTPTGAEGEAEILAPSGEAIDKMDAEVATSSQSAAAEISTDGAAKLSGDKPAEATAES